MTNFREEQITTAIDVRLGRMADRFGIPADKLHDLATGDAKSFKEWASYVPQEVHELWPLLPLEARILAIIWDAREEQFATGRDSGLE